MSNRDLRVSKKLGELSIDEHRAQQRVANAQSYLASLAEHASDNKTKTEALEEHTAACAELRAIHTQQSRIVCAAQRHTQNLPDGAIIVVLNRHTGEQEVFERRDEDTHVDTGVWHLLGDTENTMTFTEVIGIDENYAGHEYFRLYTEEQVDDMLDSAGVDDTFMC